MSEGQLGLFEGRKLRDAGIELTRTANEEWVEWMRERAIDLTSDGRHILTDDLHAIADVHNYHPKEPRSYGGIFFPRKNWVKVGYTQSKRSVCHARPIPVWTRIK